MSDFLGRFVHRPTLVLMVALTILVVGGIAVLRLPLQLMPDGLASNWINMWIPVRTSTPEEVEREVYAPLEGQILTIPGVKSVRGFCGARGTRIRVELSPNLDPRLGVAEIRDRIQRTRPSWPEEVDRWWSWRESSDTIPLMFFAIGLPGNDQRWHDLVDNVIRPKLEAIEGVGEVLLFGRIGQSIRIFFDRQKLRQHRLSLFQILQSLKDDNRSLPIGDLHEGPRRFLVRADFRYADLETIRDLPIGKGLRIRDVAKVEQVRSFRDRVSRVDGKFAVSGLIRKVAGANTVDTARRVKAFFSGLRRDPKTAGIEPIWFFDQGEFIKDSLDQLVQSSLMGGLLAFFVLLFFLRRLGMTLAITLSLPLSVLVACTTLFFQDGSFNLITMASLTIALGMLVDNSVVVLENIYRLRQSGLDWSRACIRGVQEVGTAVSLATLTTIVVFLPMILMGDDPGSKVILGSFGLPLSSALLASLFVALILLPATTRVLHLRERGGEDGAGEVPSSRGFVAAFTRLQLRSLAWCLRRRFTALTLIALAGGALIAFIAQGWRFEVGNQGHRGQLSVYWDYPKGTTLAEAAEISGEIEDLLLARREEWKLRHVIARFDRRNCNLSLSFLKGRSAAWIRKVEKDLRTLLPEKPGIEYEINNQVGGRGEDAKEGDRGFMIELSGRDSAFLRDWAKALKERLLARGLAKDVDLGRTEGQDEVRIRIDRSRMQELGVDPEVLFAMVGGGLRGREVSKIHRPDGREMSLIAEYDDSEDMELKDLKELQIWAGAKGFRRLGDLASFRFAKGFEGIRRQNGVLVTSVAGTRPEGLSFGDFQRSLVGLMKEMPVPRGYKWEIGGRARSQREQAGELFQALGLGLILVFLVMGLLFESVVLPLAVYLTVPLAIVSGLTILIASGGLIEAPVIIGLMVLVGVVVNNGIVLLDHIVRLRSRGLDRREALLRGTRDRIRPILMTALTTVVGLTPMIFNDPDGQQGFSYKGMAIVVGGGLLCATILTPTLVPIGYTLLDDFRRWFRRAIRAPSPARTPPLGPRTRFS